MFCPHCGKELADDQTFCSHCGARLVDVGAGSLTESADKRSKTRWEDREANGFFNGLFGTVKDVLFSPSDFFRKMPVSGGLIDPLLFALIIGTTGLMFLNMWDVLLHDSMRNFMTPEMKAAAGRTLFQGLGPAVTAVMTPFLLILWLFIASGMLHLLLLMVHGAKAGFEATFRVVSYSMSPYLFMIIPYCGALITLLWVMMLAIIGLKEAHETTGGKSVFAVLFPFLFCCGLSIIVAALFMGAIAASFGSLLQMYK